MSRRSKRKARRRKQRRENQSGPHHIVPSSRGGQRWKWNLFRGISGDRFWPPQAHNVKHPAYHAMYENRIPSEVIAYIREKLTGKRGGLLLSILTPNRRRAYELLWGLDTPLEDIIAWIEERFLPAEIRFRAEGHILR